MKLKKFSKPMPRVSSTTIDAAILARINEKIAKAHAQNEMPFVPQGRKSGTVVEAPRYFLDK